MNWSKTFLVIAFAICALSSHGRANIFLDQDSESSRPPPFTAGIWNKSGDILAQAQTFNVGLDGTLEQIDVVAYRQSATQPLTMRILGTTADGSPDSSNVLTSMSLSSFLIPTVPGALRSYVLPPSAWVPVHRGEVLAIAMSDDSLDTSGIYVWEGNGDSSYGRGNSFEQVNHGPWVTLQATPFGFRTWVDTAPVPEPCLLAFIAPALLLLRRNRM